MIILEGRYFNAHHKFDGDENPYFEVVDVLNKKIYTGVPVEVKIDRDVERFGNHTILGQANHRIVFEKYDVKELTDKYLIKRLIINELNNEIEDDNICEEMAEKIYTEIELGGYLNDADRE